VLKTHVDIATKWRLDMNTVRNIITSVVVIYSTRTVRKISLYPKIILHIFHLK